MNRLSTVKISQFIRSIDLFEGLAQAEIEQVVASGRQLKHEAGTFIHFQGEPAEKFHVLLEGKIKLSQVTPEGHQVILRYVSPGEAFAVVAVLSNINYPVTAEAAEDCVTLTWDEGDMHELMLHYPQIAINALSILAKRTREFQDRLRELSTERVERRIARALLRLARQTGRKVEQGVLIDLQLTRQDLAEMTGTTLYTVSRTVSQWESRGIVETGRERFVILQPHGLVVIAEDLPQDDAGRNVG